MKFLIKKLHFMTLVMFGFISVANAQILYDSNGFQTFDENIVISLTPYTGTVYVSYTASNLQVSNDLYIDFVDTLNNLTPINGLISGISTFTDRGVSVFSAADGVVAYQVDSSQFPPQPSSIIMDLCIATVTGLCVPSVNISPSTLVDLAPNAHALRGAFSMQSALINTGLTYDCTTFDKNGICLSAGGRVTNTNNPSTNSQGALLIASYRASDHWRVGAYLDQGLTTKDARGINIDNSNPMAGLFAVWSERGNGLGSELRLAAGYNENDISITRNSGLNSEAGRGKSSIRAQAFSAIYSHGLDINGSAWIASPYLGLRYTKIERTSYTEDLTAAVTTPLSYAGLSQETTTALAGVRLNGKIAERVFAMVSAGLESDLSHNTRDYVATGLAGLNSIEFNQNVRRTRPVAQAGVSYGIDARQSLGAQVHYRQEAFNSTHSLTGMVNYQIGF